MNQEQRQRMHQKLLDTQRYLTETEDKKRQLTASMNDEIKASKKRINALVEAIDNDSFEPLMPIFGGEELKFFEFGKI